MADNITAPVAAGTKFAFDQVTIGGESVLVGRTKIGFGADGSYTEVDSGNPLPVVVSTLPLSTGAATSAKQDALAALVGEVQASPTSNTLLDRVKALLTGIVLATGANIIGRVGIDQTTDGTTNKVNIDASLKSGTATRSSVSSGISSATILASNANRKGATIFNSDANALLLDLSGGTAAATRCQVRLTQYQSYEVGSGYTGAITGIWEADGSGIADVVEFT